MLSACPALTIKNTLALGNRMIILQSVCAELKLTFPSSSMRIHFFLDLIIIQRQYYPMIKPSKLLPKSKMTKHISHKNKENQFYDDEYSKFKKFSVDLHKQSRQTPQNNQKSIFEEEISVFLELSNKKSSTDKDNSELLEDIKILNAVIEKRGSIIEALMGSMSQIRSNQVRKLVTKIAEKMSSQSFSLDQFQKSSDKQNLIFLNQSRIRPYFEHQLLQLQRNFDKLILQKKELEDIKSVEKSKKNNLLQYFKKIYQKQQQELNCD